MAGEGVRNYSRLRDANVDLVTMFNEALDNIEDPAIELAMEVPSGGEANDYDWFEAVPGFTEWVGERKLGLLSAQAYRLVNREWANGILIKRSSLRDDKLRMQRPRIASLAQKARLHAGQLVVQRMIEGFTTGLGYDGLSFFNAAHPNGGNGFPFSNVTTAQLSLSAYWAARQAMHEIKDEEGDPLRVSPNVLVVGPKLEELAMEITTANLKSNAGDATDNVARQHNTRVIMSHELTGATDDYWFLADLRQAVRPMIYQVREGITASFTGNANEGVSLEGLISDDLFMSQKLKFGAQASYEVGFGFPQLIYGSDGTV